ncbi:MAG: ATP-binding protein [Treponema sp.]|nr:ATP-binding protein [Treponema sp.]MCL2250575.1 ATP-binding protein [Treponema sp.]
MKTVKTGPDYSIIKVRTLILIYSLLCFLTLIFSRNFFIETLGGNVPDTLNLIVFFTIPAVLLIILGISAFQLLTDFLFRRPGGKFNVRLLAYFAIIVIFSVTPITVMTSSALYEIVRFWHNIDAYTANRAANSFIADNYSHHLEHFESIIKQSNFSNPLPKDIASVQVFRYTDGNWVEYNFTGDEEFNLSSPPINETGFPIREMPRDFGTIRYVQRMSQNTLRVINYNLGTDFDKGKAALENQIEHFDQINLLRKNLRPLLIYYYAVFFLPTLLMTAIIAISFTRRITHPIIALTEATQKVAEGNFSIQILTRRNDELGTLIKSFNSMVQDLEKSREAIVRNEKISIWQNMAQQLAHEIKNPLTPIKLSAERVLRRWRNEPEKIGEIIESSMMAIIQETEGLSALLNEFRTLSKPMEPSKSNTELSEPLNEAIISYSSSYPNVTFDISHIKKDILIKIDKHRLAQIITNLIINAIDAMNGTGSIEIRTDLVKKREVCYCRISVKDSGNGIGKEESRLIFTPYFTTKESGTGLGLPIVERIVNDHGGAIWFDSAEGIGTTFYIDLPAEKTEDTQTEFS